MSKNKVSADLVSLETSPCLAESHLLTMAPHSFYSVPMCTWSLFPGSSVHGFLQARKLEWVDIPFSRGLPNPGIKPGSPALEANYLPSEPPQKAVTLN